MIHFGYLAYNREDKTCRIPNKEVRQEWFNAVETEPEYEATNRIIQASKELLSETIRGNEDALQRAQLNRLRISSTLDHWSIMQEISCLSESAMMRIKRHIAAG